jgi:hypothetical protein
VVYYYSILNEMEKIFIHSVCVCVCVCVVVDVYTCVCVCMYSATLYSHFYPLLSILTILFFLPSFLLSSFCFLTPFSAYVPCLVHYILIYSICIILHMTSFFPLSILPSYFSPLIVSNQPNLFKLEGVLKVY